MSSQSTPTEYPLRFTRDDWDDTAKGYTHPLLGRPGSRIVKVTRGTEVLDPGLCQVTTTSKGTPLLRVYSVPPQEELTVQVQEADPAGPETALALRTATLKLTGARLGIGAVALGIVYKVVEYLVQYL